MSDSIMNGAATTDATTGVHAGNTKEKKTSDKDLDLSNCNRGVWLVKVPKYIADRWESGEPNSIVGNIKIAKRQGQKPAVTFTLDDKVTVWYWSICNT